MYVKKNRTPRSKDWNALCYQYVITSRASHCIELGHIHVCVCVYVCVYKHISNYILNYFKRIITLQYYNSF